MKIQEIIAELERRRNRAQRMIVNTRSSSQSQYAQGEKSAYDDALQLLEQREEPSVQPNPSGFDETL